MKITNLSSKSPEQSKFKSDNFNAIEQGITKRLLEKYKPKYLYSMDNMRIRNNEKRVA